MNKKVLITVFLALAFIGASLGYRSATLHQQPENESIKTGSPKIASLDSTLAIEANLPQMATSDVFDDLKLAASGRDNATLLRMRDGWIAACSQQEFEELIDLVGSERDTVWRGIMMEAMAGRWATFDPHAAIDFMTNQVHSERRQAGLTRIFEVLATKDPATAFAMIAETSEAAGHPANMQPATEAVFSEWKKHDSAAAFTAAETINDERHRWSALRALCSAENDIERAQVFESIRAMDNLDFQRDAWKQAISNWAKQASFEQVVDWIGEQTFEDSLASRLEREVASRHGDEDPREMAEWLVARADEDSLPGHLEAAVRFWADDQPNACGEWLHEIGLGSHTDRAVEAFAYTVMRHDAPSAFAWAQSIQDNGKREDVLHGVSRHFYRFNPKGFLETVAASELPAAEQSALIEKIRKVAEFR